MSWRFENTGFHPGEYNMRFDEELVKAALAGTGSPTVRVYGWDPPAISVGWNQATDEIDAQQAAESGIDVVRRPTGGRAILHSEELTYSVVMESKGGTVSSDYERISRALVCGLRNMGVDVSIEKSQPDFPSLYRQDSGVACFSSSARYEIKVAGKKLVGSAQRRYRRADRSEVVLQHGSILIGPAHRRIVEFLRLPEIALGTLKKELEERTTDLSSALGREVLFNEVAEFIEFGFEKARNLALRDQSEKNATIA